MALSEGVCRIGFLLPAGVATATNQVLWGSQCLRMLKESNVEYQTRTTEMPWLSWVGGIALGALAMYIADPSQGRRRRALLQDKVSSVTHSTSELMDQTLHDMRNRWSGVQASALRLLSPRQAKPIDDHVLEARVRSRLGRAMSHLRDLEIHAHQGRVTLSGNLSSESREEVLRLVAAIPGVDSVSGPVPDLMSGLHRRDIVSPLWIAGAAGAGLLTWYVLTRRQPLGLMAIVSGLGLISTRGAAPGRGRVAGLSDHGYEAERTIDIAAPPDVVFDVWSRYENFPHFMSHVTEVRDLGQNRSHWIVQGPGGADMEWNAVLTTSERPHRLAWRSEPDASVEHEGMVLLEPLAEGTRATVRLAWHPPAGAAGKALAVLTGTDPQSALDEDLLRMKAFIEHGLPARGSSGPLGGGNVLH